MNHYRTNIPQHNRIVFFDLEYYVPEKHRRKDGLSYNPWVKECKLLGGTFFTANPTTDIAIDSEKIEKRKSMKSFWLWHETNESALVKKIYLYLKDVLAQVKKSKTGYQSPLLCGIGISASDVPVLIDLFKRYHLMNNEEAFRFQNQFRYIDLSQLAISCFRQPNDFLYPKTKNDLLNKFKIKQSFENGKSVWSLYENKQLSLIEKRVRQEIIATHEIYKGLINEFRLSIKLKEKK